MARERIYFRVSVIDGKGCLIAADNQARALLAQRKYKEGDIVLADVKKPRSVRFNRFAHNIGTVVKENVAGFELMDAHKVLKRLQLESGVACDEIGIVMPNIGHLIQKIPRSFSFDEMGEEEYRESMRLICDYVADRYMPACTGEQVARLVECMVD